MPKNGIAGMVRRRTGGSMSSKYGMLRVSDDSLNENSRRSKLSGMRYACGGQLSAITESAINSFYFLSMRKIPTGCILALYQVWFIASNFWQDQTR
jgi:hypothetical protein